MSDLQSTDAFRAHTRAWLEQNCPAEMRTPMTAEGDICWGGRKPHFTSDAQRIWLDRMADTGPEPPPHGHASTGERAFPLMRQARWQRRCSR